MDWIDGLCYRDATAVVIAAVALIERAKSRQSAQCFFNLRFGAPVGKTFGGLVTIVNQLEGRIGNRCVTAPNGAIVRILDDELLHFKPIVVNGVDWRYQVHGRLNDLILRLNGTVQHNVSSREVVAVAATAVAAIAHGRYGNVAVHSTLNVGNVGLARAVSKDRNFHVGNIGPTGTSEVNVVDVFINTRTKDRYVNTRHTAI